MSFARDGRYQCTSRSSGRANGQYLTKPRLAITFAILVISLTFGISTIKVRPGLASKSHPTPTSTPPTKTPFETTWYVLPLSSYADSHERQQHPNEYIRGATLRFLPEISKEVQLFEPPFPTCCCLDGRVILSELFPRIFAPVALPLLPFLYSVSSFLCPSSCRRHFDGI